MHDESPMTTSLQSVEINLNINNSKDSIDSSNNNNDSNSNNGHFEVIFLQSALSLFI